MKLYDFLYVMNQNHGLSQRQIAQICNISLGKVNQLLKEAQEKDYIKITKNNLKYSYLLTEKGLESIEQDLSNKGNHKIKLHQGNEIKINTAVILAAGKREDFDVPAAFLNIDDETTLIERNIRILFENEVENIIIVIGYKSELFVDLVKKYPKITLVKNDDYSRTGTMQSLSLTKDFIKNDFILLESDIIFESTAIKKLIENDERDCMIITNESGSGDEAFVEIRNRQIYNMTKDIHQINKIDGEMIGLSKISLPMFEKMIKRFNSNQNPYLNYEYMLMDIGRKFKVGYVKLANLVWWEFDTFSQFQIFKKSIYRKLQNQEKKWIENEVKQTIAYVLNIDINTITNIGYIGGMTNTSYKATIDGKDYIARIPGHGTNELISRTNEERNCIIANQLDLDAKIIYIDAMTGIKIAEFIKDAETLTTAMSKRADIMLEVTKLFKKLHHSGIIFKNDFDVFTEIEKYEVLIKEFKGYLFEDYLDTKSRVIELKSVLEKLGRQNIACHNDTASFNILKDINEKFYLIDWEYAGNNDPIWDLAAYALESEFTKEEEFLLLQNYFEKKEVEEKYTIKLLIFQICQDFLWSVWTCIKEAKGNDFGTYGLDRYNRCKQKLDELDCILSSKGRI